MKKQPEVTKATRKAITDAFAALYKDKNIKDITIRMLTEKAGISRATFYRYFADIYAVYEYIEQFVFEKLEDGISVSMETLELQDAFIDRISAVYQQWREYLEVLFKEDGRNSFAIKVKEKGKATLMERLDLPLEDKKTSYVLDYYMTAVVTVAGRWINHPEELSRKELGEVLKGLVTDGVGARLLLVSRHG